MKSNQKFEGSSAISKGLGNALTTIAEIGSLPMVRGQYYFVDPTDGSDSADGRTVETSMKGLAAAYAKAADGDGIALLSYGATSDATSSYLTQELVWAKNGITVVGVSAPVGIFGRARVANKTIVSTVALTAVADTSLTRATGSFITDGWEVGMKFITSVNATALTVATVTATVITITAGTLTVGAHTHVTSVMVNLITLSGSNNRFFNVNMFNGGTNVLEIGGLNITGARNYFENCHIVGAGHATPGAVTTSRSILLDAAEEAVFNRCVIGTDTVLKAAANGEVRIDGDCKRIRFIECEGLCNSATASKGFLQSVDATSFSGVLLFDRCKFVKWNENAPSAATSWFIGTAPTSGEVWLNDSATYGWAAWDSVTTNDRVYVSNGAVHAATGGLALVTS